MQLDREVQVCGICLFIFLSTLWFEILLLLFRGVMVHIYLMLFDWSTRFSLCFFEHFFLFFSMTPFSFCKKRNLFGTWSTYFWWMDGMFCVTPCVGVSMYMWVYVISIMEAWKVSINGHNNLAKFIGSQASICESLYFDIDIWLW
jgi:hypothetical protein